MNPMHGPSHICRSSKLFITTEVESRHSLPPKAVRESLGMKLLDCKKRVASGRKSLGSLPVRPSPARVHRLIGKVNRYEETAHPLKGSPLAAAVNPCRPIAGQFSPPSFLVTRPASESTLIETVRLSNVGLNPAKELEGIDVGRL